MDISSGTPRYTRWFGSYDDDRRSTVEDHFKLISSSDFSSFTYDCTCTQTDIYAYVCTYAFQLRDFIQPPTNISTRSR